MGSSGEAGVGGFTQKAAADSPAVEDPYFARRIRISPSCAQLATSAPSEAR